MKMKMQFKNNQFNKKMKSLIAQKLYFQLLKELLNVFVLLLLISFPLANPSNSNDINKAFKELKELKIKLDKHQQAYEEVYKQFGSNPLGQNQDVEKKTIAITMNQDGLDKNSPLEQEFFQFLIDYQIKIENKMKELEKKCKEQKNFDLRSEKEAITNEIKKLNGEMVKIAPATYLGKIKLSVFLLNDINSQLKDLDTCDGLLKYITDHYVDISDTLGEHFDPPTDDDDSDDDDSGSTSNKSDKAITTSKGTDKGGNTAGNKTGNLLASRGPASVSPTDPKYDHSNPKVESANPLSRGANKDGDRVVSNPDKVANDGKKYECDLDNGAQTLDPKQPILTVDQVNELGERVDCNDGQYGTLTKLTSEDKKFLGFSYTKTNIEKKIEENLNYDTCIKGIGKACLEGLVELTTQPVIDLDLNNGTKVTKDDVSVHRARQCAKCIPKNRQGNFDQDAACDLGPNIKLLSGASTRVQDAINLMGPESLSNNIFPKGCSESTANRYAECPMPENEIKQYTDFYQKCAEEGKAEIQAARLGIKKLTQSSNKKEIEEARIALKNAHEDVKKKIKKMSLDEFADQYVKDGNILNPQVINTMKDLCLDANKNVNTQQYIPWTPASGTSASLFSSNQKRAIAASQVGFLFAAGFPVIGLGVASTFIIADRLSGGKLFDLNENQKNGYIADCFSIHTVPDDGNCTLSVSEISHVNASAQGYQDGFINTNPATHSIKVAEWEKSKTILSEKYKNLNKELNKKKDADDGANCKKVADVVKEICDAQRAGKAANFFAAKNSCALLTSGEMKDYKKIADEKKKKSPNASKLTKEDLKGEFWYDQYNIPTHSTAEFKEFLERCKNISGTQTTSDKENNIGYIPMTSINQTGFNYNDSKFLRRTKAQNYYLGRNKQGDGARCSEYAVITGQEVTDPNIFAPEKIKNQQAIAVNEALRAAHGENLGSDFCIGCTKQEQIEKTRMDNNLVIARNLTKAAQCQDIARKHKSLLAQKPAKDGITCESSWKDALYKSFIDYNADNEFYKHFASFLGNCSGDQEIQTKLYGGCHFEDKQDNCLKMLQGEELELYINATAGVLMSAKYTYVPERPRQNIGYDGQREPTAFDKKIDQITANFLTGSSDFKGAFDIDKSQRGYIGNVKLSKSCENAELLARKRCEFAYMARENEQIAKEIELKNKNVANPPTPKCDNDTTTKFYNMSGDELMMTILDFNKFYNELNRYRTETSNGGISLNDLKCYEMLTSKFMAISGEGVRENYVNKVQKKILQDPKNQCSINPDMASHVKYLENRCKVLGMADCDKIKEHEIKDKVGGSPLAEATATQAYSDDTKFNYPPNKPNPSATNSYEEEEYDKYGYDGKGPNNMAEINHLIQLVESLNGKVSSLELQLISERGMYGKGLNVITTPAININSMAVTILKDGPYQDLSNISNIKSTNCTVGVDC